MLLALQCVEKRFSKVFNRTLHLTLLCLQESKNNAECDLDKCQKAIIQIVQKAGEIIAKENTKPKNFQTKLSNVDLVTEFDTRVEQLLVCKILEQFPSHKFIGEEDSSNKVLAAHLTDAPTWIIDPIDGTMNFVHSFPHSCISVGLVVNKVIEIGVIYNPVLQQHFTARRGQGAFYNGNPIKVSGQKELKFALIASGICTSRAVEEMEVAFSNFAKVAKASHGLRLMGSAALHLGMVALGALDATYEFGPHAWDTCAGVLVVREAGGVVIDPAGGEFDIMSRRVLAAATPELAQELSKSLTQYYLPRDDCVK